MILEFNTFFILQQEYALEMFVINKTLTKYFK
jgi:hypothetical protein